MKIGKYSNIIQASIFPELFRIYLVPLLYRKNNLE